GPAGCGPQLRGQPLPSYNPFGTLPGPLYAPALPAPSYQWTQKGDGACLWRDGVQVGYWDYDKKQYCPRDPVSREWGPWSPNAPVQPPADPRPQKAVRAGAPKVEQKADPEEKPRPDQVAQNFGVDTSRCQGEAHYLRGEKVTRREVYEAVGSQLPDDRDKLRIHLIGPKAETRPFVEA